MKSTIKQQVSYFLSAFAFIFVLFVGMQIGFAAIGGGQYNGNMTNPSSPTHAMGFLSSDDPLPTKVGSLILKDFNTSAHSYLLGNSTYQNDCISHKAGAEKETCLEATGNGAGYGFFNLLSALDNNTQQMITLTNGSAKGGKFAVTPYSNKNPFPDADFVEEQFNDGNDSMLISSLAMKDANGNFAPSDPNHLRPVCVDAQGMLTTDCGAGATVSYSCSGTIVNGQMCSGDDQDLTQNGTWHAVRNCGVNKCEYICNSDYHEENGACVADATYHWDTGDWGQCKDHYCDTAFPGHFGWCSDIENQQNCEDALGTPPNDPEQPVCEWKSSPNPVRTRAVQCVDQSGTVVADSNCSGTKPSDTDECQTVRIYIAAHCNGSTADQCCTNYTASDEIYMLDILYNSDTSGMFDYNSSGKMSLKHSSGPGVLEVPVGVTYPFHPDSYTQGGSLGFGYNQSELLAVKTAGVKVSTSDGEKALIRIIKEQNSNNAYIDSIYFCSSSSSGGSSGGGSGGVTENQT